MEASATTMKVLMILLNQKVTRPIKMIQPIQNILATMRMYYIQQYYNTIAMTSINKLF